MEPRKLDGEKTFFLVQRCLQLVWGEFRLGSCPIGDSNGRLFLWERYWRLARYNLSEYWASSICEESGGMALETGRKKTRAGSEQKKWDVSKINVRHWLFFCDLKPIVLRCHHNGLVLPTRQTEKWFLLHACRLFRRSLLRLEIFSNRCFAKKIAKKYFAFYAKQTPRGVEILDGIKSEYFSLIQINVCQSKMPFLPFFIASLFPRLKGPRKWHLINHWKCSSFHLLAVKTLV